MNLILRILLKLSLWMASWFIAPICRLFTIGARKKCPPIDNPLLMHSAKELAQKIRLRQVTSEEIIKAYIARSFAVNKILNAIVEPRYDEALQEARLVDKMIENGEFTEEQLITKKPLLGVPISVKESIAVEGMSNDAGRLYFEYRVPATEDAEVIEVLKEAGAIPFLVSNTSDQCMFWETYNKVSGLTKNPYDTRRTVGGSAGGEAALLGSGASVIGIGSDIAGSLRLPAMYNGIFGHKPTPHTVSIKGHIPECFDKRFPDYFSLGPMVRYSEDLSLILNIITKNEYKNILKLDSEVPIKNLKIYYMENDSNSYITNRVDRDITRQMRKLIEFFRTEHGVVAEKVRIESLKNAYETSFLTLLQMNGLQIQFYDEANPKTLSGVWKEFFRFLMWRSNTTFPVILYGLLKIFSQKLKRKTREAYIENNKLREEFLALLKDNAVFLYPTFTGAAHFHYEMYYKLFDIAYLTIFNTIGLPVTNCPLGFNSQGLPIGIQVAAAPFNDRLTIAVAEEIEKAFGGWKPPPSNIDKNNDVLQSVNVNK